MTGQYMSPLQCKLCGGGATTVLRDQPCFQGPQTFNVEECEWCDTRFVSPMVSGSDVYDLIYEKSSAVPGYDRYRRYAEALTWNPDPLNYLASQEDVYWSIKKSIEALETGKGKLRVLEVGSGFGYLTYALRKAGHDCTGIDISSRAVDKARKDFGPFYQVSDLMDYVDVLGSGFDVVVATELVEHVCDPMALVQRACMHLRPGGSLVLTTPNKDLYSDRMAWHTDLAPVHLWWFSKTSMRRMAWTIGLDVSFVDFSEFYGDSPRPVRGGTKPQTFDATGKVIYKDSAVNTIARFMISIDSALFKPLGRVFLKKMARQRLSDAPYRESLSLCAVMRRPAQAIAVELKAA
jgi:2-polyprenyl-3-methyl-5-hydroxy-6-metoxy-1,4-benzoquinol methylase